MFVFLGGATGNDYAIEPMLSNGTRNALAPALRTKELLRSSPNYVRQATRKAHKFLEIKGISDVRATLADKDADSHG
jgi:hypothetical protein